MWGYDLLAASRLTRRIQTLAAVLEAPDQLIYLNTTPITPALDGEIFGTYEGAVVSADIVQDDASAVIRSGGRYQLNTSAIPNIKQGSLVTQSMLNLLNRINANGAIQGDVVSVRNYVRNELNNKLQACRIMMNRMICGMHMDQFTYRKMGIIYDNVSWGMPAGLKFNPSVGWDSTSSTPVTDLLLYLRTAAQDFGEQYNRIRLGTKLFNYVIATADFRSYAANYFAPAGASNTTFAGLLNNTGQMRTLLEQITNLRWDINDAVYREELNDGTHVSKRYQPDNIAILGNTADDNNAGSADFANAIVNETEIGIVPGTQVIGGGFTAPEYGPVSYATIRGDLNPPNLTLWGVVRGFPRKLRKTMTARITAYTLPV